MTAAAVPLPDYTGRLQLVRCAHPTHGPHVLCHATLLEAVCQAATTRALPNRQAFRSTERGAVLKQCWRCHGWNVVILHL